MRVFLFLYFLYFYICHFADADDVVKKYEDAVCVNSIIGNNNKIDFNSIFKKKISENKSDNNFDSIVKYEALKKTQSEVESNVFFLEGNAKVEVGDTKLEAEKIKLAVKKDYNIVEGFGKKTKKGYLDPRVSVTFNGKKIFADKIRYCIDSARGLADNAFYFQDKLIMRAKFLKKDFDDTIYAKKAFLTTCNAEKPHYGFIADKVILHGNKVFIAGGKLMLLGVIVPIPFYFIYFIPQERKTGFTYPSGANWSDRGFYIKDFGFYWYMNDCRDLHVTGTLYFGSLTLGVSIKHNYIVRDSYSGTIEYTYNADPIYIRYVDIANIYRNNWTLRWTHRTLGNKKWSFAIDVNLHGKGRGDGHSDEDSDGADSNASITFSVPKFLKVFSFNLKSDYSKDFKTKIENITFPNISLSTETINFLKYFSFTPSVVFLIKSTNKKVDYAVRDKHDIETDEEIKVDDLDSFSNFRTIWDNISGGFKFDSPINFNIEILKGVKIGAHVSYGARIYKSRYDINTETIKPKEGCPSFYYIHEFSISGSANTTLKSKSIKFNEFGRYNPAHISEIYSYLYPSISLSWTPEANKINQKINGENPCYADKNDKTFDLFKHTVFGNVHNHESLNLNFSVKWTMEAKRNTESGYQKINLFDFNISSGYDFLDEKRNFWQDIHFNLNFKIWKINFNFDATFFLYEYEKKENGMEYYITDKFCYEGEFNLENLKNNIKKMWKDQRLSSSTSISMPIFVGKGIKKEDEKVIKNDNLGNEDENKLPKYTNFTILDSFNSSLSYRYAYNFNPVQRKIDITHTISVNYSFKISKGWDFRGDFVFDITKIQFKSFNFGANCYLHCWNLSTNFSIGRDKENHWTFSYNISFSPKDSILSPLGQNRGDNYIV